MLLLDMGVTLRAQADLSINTEPEYVIRHVLRNVLKIRLECLLICPNCNDDDMSTY